MWHHGLGWGTGGWLGPFGMGPFGFIVWIVVLALIVAALVWAVRSLRRPDAPPAAQARPRGLDLVEERYARGEIGRDEYLEKRRDLLG